MPGRRWFLGLGVASFLVCIGVLVPGVGLAGGLLDLLLVVALGFDWMRARRQKLVTRRRWPPLLAQGSPVEVAVDLEAPGSARPLIVVLREGLCAALAPDVLRVRLRTEPGRRLRWSYLLRPLRRGDHEVAPLLARVQGPWGLAWHQRELLPVERCRVYPRVRWGGRIGRLLAAARRQQLGVQPLRRAGAGEELYALRPYRPGDALGRIHWRASARHGRLVSRDDTWQRGAALVILLDAARGMAGDDEEESKLDGALAAALALTRLAAGRGDRVSLVAFSDRIERAVRVRAGAGGMRDAYAALYDLEARLREPAYELAVERCLDLEPRGGTVVLLTSIADLAAAEVLRDCLLRLARRHRVLVVNLEDAALRRLADTPPPDAVHAYAQLASLELRLANRRLGRRLARAGIRAVHCPADRLTAATFEAYLEMVAGQRPQRENSAA